MISKSNLFTGDKYRGSTNRLKNNRTMSVRPSPKHNRDVLKEALLDGTISHSDLEEIIRRFQAYEKHVVLQKAGLPADTEE